MSPLIRLAVSCFALWLAPFARADLVPPAAPAATAPASAAAPAAEPAPPATIDAPEIVTRAEDAKALVRRIEDRKAEDEVQSTIAEQLPHTSEKLRERAGRANEMLELRPTLDALDDLDGEWRARSQKLADWRIALTRTAQTAEADLAALAAERALWERTREAPEAANLPPATQARLKETIELLAHAEQKLQKKRASILTLQNEVSEEEVVVRGMVDRVAKQREDLSKQMFERDAPPLWSPEAYAPSGDSAFLPEKLRGAVTRRIDLLHEFASLSLSRLQLEGLFFVGVLGALLVARRRLRPSPEAQADPALAVPTRIFDRPVSAALLVSVLWATWAGFRAPGVLSEFEGLVLLIPVLRLLPRDLFEDFKPALIGLALLFTAGSLRSFFGVVPTAERFLLLPENVGTIALLYWVQKPANADRFRRVGRHGGVVAPAARIALALCLAALVCNVLGLVLLSRRVLRGVAAGLYGAVAIYALVRFANGVVTAFVRSNVGRKLRVLRDHGELVRTRVHVFQQWVGVAAWLWFALRVAGLQDAMVDGVTKALAAKLEVGTVSLSVGNIVAFFLSIWLTVHVSRFVRFVLGEEILPHIALPRGVPAAISTGVHYTILAIGFLIAIGAAGFDLGKFSLLAGALGVGIGFGLQNVVNNFVSGLILLFERPVQVGDTIEVGNLSGEVKRIGIRSSTLRTGEGADVIVPNASLISDRLVNWTFSDRTRRVDLDVSVAYGSDANKVTGILLEAAKAHGEVMSQPEPVALLTRFAESALTFQLQVVCRVELQARIKSELAIAVHTALRSAGIDISVPQREVHLKVEPRDA